MKLTTHLFLRSTPFLVICVIGLLALCPDLALAQGYNVQAVAEERFITGKFAALLILVSAAIGAYFILASGGQGKRNKNQILLAILFLGIALWLFMSRLVAYSGAGDRFERYNNTFLDEQSSGIQQLV